MDDDVQLPLLTILRLRLFTSWFEPLVIALVRWYTYAYNYYYYGMMTVNIWLFNRLKSEIFAAYTSRHGIVDVMAAYVTADGAEEHNDFVHLNILNKISDGVLHFSNKKLMFLLENLIHSDCSLENDKCISMADVKKFTRANIIHAIVRTTEGVYDRIVVQPDENFATFMYSKKKNSEETRTRVACETSHFQLFA